MFFIQFVFSFKGINIKFKIMFLCLTTFQELSDHSWLTAITLDGVMLEPKNNDNVWRSGKHFDLMNAYI